MSTTKQKAIILKIQSNLFAVFIPNQVKNFESNEGLLYTEKETYEWLQMNCELPDADLGEMSFGERLLCTMKKGG